MFEIKDKDVSRFLYIKNNIIFVYVFIILTFFFFNLDFYKDTLTYVLGSLNSAAGHSVTLKLF